MKIAVLTSNPNSFLIENISKYYTLETVCHELRTSIRHFLPFYLRRARKHPFRISLEVMYQIVKLLVDKHEQRNFSYQGPICKTTNINSKKITKVLSAIDPDILLIDGTSIVKNRVLKIAKRGVINVHCGINPLYRGGGNPWVVKLAG